MIAPSDPGWPVCTCLHYADQHEYNTEARTHLCTATGCGCESYETLVPIPSYLLVLHFGVCKCKFPKGV